MSNDESKPSVSAPPNTPNQTAQQGGDFTHADGVDNNIRQPQNGSQHNSAEIASASMDEHWELTTDPQVQDLHNAFSGSGQREQQPNCSS